MRVLLLEDDAETAGVVSRGLRERGYGVEVAGDVPSALALLAKGSFEVAVLDIMVPGGSGYDVLAELRRRTPHVAALILTARDAVEERVDGLERGADDYLVKPFAFAELLARLRALVRRPAKGSASLWVGELEIDTTHRLVRTGEARVELTRTEFDLLLCLAEHRGEVLNRRILLEAVWDYRFEPGTNVVDVHINRLRRRLESAGATDVVRTVRGVGYVVD